jgi:hypothetical protein
MSVDARIPSQQMSEEGAFRMEMQFKKAILDLA